MSEEKKAADPFVVDKPDPRAVFREEKEKRRTQRAQVDAPALAEAKMLYEKHLESRKKKERRDKSMGGRAVPKKTIPPSHQE